MDELFHLFDGSVEAKIKGSIGESIVAKAHAKLSKLLQNKL